VVVGEKPTSNNIVNAWDVSHLRYGQVYYIESHGGMMFATYEVTIGVILCLC
jgi:hypothetical protein